MRADVFPLPEAEPGVSMNKNSLRFPEEIGLHVALLSEKGLRRFLPAAQSVRILNKHLAVQVTVARLNALSFTTALTTFSGKSTSRWGLVFPA